MTIVSHIILVVNLENVQWHLLSALYSYWYNYLIYLKTVNIKRKPITIHYINHLIK